jgi:hypothetical protein
MHVWPLECEVDDTCQIVCVVAQKLSQENGTKMKRANPGTTSRTIFASSTL